MPQDVIAHICTRPDGKLATHSLDDHLKGVAELCRTFVSEATGCNALGELGYLLGTLHDVGKNLPSFQTYIKRSCGMDTSAKAYPAPHSPAGAIFANKLQSIINDKLKKILSLIVAAHHRGLYDDGAWLRVVNDSENKGYRYQYKDLIKILGTDTADYGISESEVLKSWEKYDVQERALLIRILFSCLIDADFLDTELFMNPAQSSMRERVMPSFEELREKLKAHTDRFKQDTAINKVRKEFLETCIKAGKESETGIYSLFLPTGGGKTLSSMAWALEKALASGHKRIIYVIPYTSIITQTASIFKEIFGEENVLEHHSDIEFRDDDESSRLRQKLSAENWDAPIIVTTNVQFFESLYSNRVGRCRKLHNIANSVIILDEVQTFPTELENPIIRAIESLNYGFRTDILLCTATLPNFDKEVGSEVVKDQKFYEFEKDIQPIVPYQAEQFAVFDKVDFHLEPQKVSHEELAHELLKYKTFLCVVNSRKDALNIYNALKEKTPDDKGLIHLSKRMCSLHIKTKIEEIKERLKKGLPTKVVSTQLIEAGVDLDFPVVFRALAGLDSVIQAAGRCNREGKLSHKGLVQVFEIEESSYKGLNLSTDAYKAVIRPSQKVNSVDLAMVKEYFRKYYGSIQSFDQKEISLSLFYDGRLEDLRFDFETAANNFRYIDDNGRDVLVPYTTEGKALISKLSAGASLSKTDFRLMSKLNVRLYDHEIKELLSKGFIRECPLGKDTILFAQEPKLYSDDTGLRLEDPYKIEDYNI